ncbi:MAG: cell division protein ZapA [Clostridia bacterium]|nr:cell division protein ZapA [Clostridia bacterium]
MPNNVRFTVGGIQYSVSGEESEEYIRSIARELERKMDAIAKQNTFLSTTMVAVMAAMDSLDRAQKVTEENNQLRDQLKEMTEKYAIARSDADQSARRLQELLDRERKQ